MSRNQSWPGKPATDASGPIVDALDSGAADLAYGVVYAAAAGDEGTFLHWSAGAIRGIEAGQAAAVAAMRARSVPWAEIGRQLGVSKQAVIKRFGATKVAAPADGHQLAIEGDVDDPGLGKPWTADSFCGQAVSVTVEPAWWVAPFDTSGGMKKGERCSGFRCPGCGQVEPNDYLLQINHGFNRATRSVSNTKCGRAAVAAARDAPPGSAPART